MNKTAFALLLCFLMLSFIGCAKTETSAPPSQALPEEEIFSEPVLENPADAEQPDPTLRENMAGSFYRWNHIEYKNFGDFANYKTVALELHDGADSPAEEALTASILLPPMCTVDGSGIEYDGNFANGTIRIGTAPEIYYKLAAGETLAENSEYPSEYYTTNPITGEVYTVAETAENIPGAYQITPRFVRRITRAVGVIDTNIIYYTVDLGRDCTASFFFFVSPEASAGDLEIYDAIASSIKLD